MLIASKYVFPWTLLGGNQANHQVQSTKWLAGCLCGEILDEELAASFTCFLVNTEGLLKVSERYIFITKLYY